MKKHTQKMIAPIVVTVLLVAYYAGLGVAVIRFEPPVLVSILAVLVPGGVAGVMIAMCIQRIKEIRSGEEDDLSQY